MEIVELRSAAEHREALPTLRELYPWLDEGRYAALLAEMVDDGYRQFALRNEAGEVVAVAGVAVHVNIYYGRYLYVYDLVVREGERSKGYGDMLMDHVEEIGRREGCQTAALAVSLDREGAQRLYERRGYQKPSYAMRKALG
jgi:ribosomal protein S18 acetylase RimI-like enzyme